MKHSTLSSSPNSGNTLVGGSTGNSVEDLMFLFGWKKNVKYGKFEQIKIEAENAWLDGKDADANPYQKGTVQNSCWYSQWLSCNKNC